MSLVPRSVRVRITIAATLVLAVVLVISSVFIVRTVDQELRSDLRDQNETTLAGLAARIEDGDDPRAIRLPLGADGTEFDITDATGDMLNSTLVFSGDSVTIEPDGTNSIDPVLGEGYFDLDQWDVTERIATAPDGAEYLLRAYSPTRIVERSVSQVRSVLVLVIPVLAASFAVLVWLTISRALRPVAAMATNADRISTETLDERLPRPGTGDEIDQLAGTLNTMLDRIQRGVARQREFVSDASHELRSPLTVMIGEAQLAVDTPTADSLARSAEVTIREGRRLEHLVGDLLTLAITDQTPIEVQELDLDHIVLEQSSLSGRSIDTSAVQPIRMWGNAATLTRVVRNLLDNAARHADRAIVVSTLVDDGAAVLIVDDDGPGVSPPDREVVFERFVRLDEARNRDAGGYGLGLALSKSIVAAHDGHIAITTSPLGGARLTVTIPVRQPSTGGPAASEPL